jgi:hypothetical protein
MTGHLELTSHKRIVSTVEIQTGRRSAARPRSVHAPSIVWYGVALNWQIEGVEDTNGDRRTDLIWRDRETGSVAVWLMNGGAMGLSGMSMVGTADSFNW